MHHVETRRRLTLVIDHHSPDEFYRMLVRWGFNQPECMLFDSCGHTQDRFYEYDWIFFAGAKRYMPWEEIHLSPPSLCDDWMGFLLAYNFKSTLVGHINQKNSFFTTPEAIFFTPRWVFYSKGQTVFAEFLPEDTESFREVLKCIQICDIRESSPNKIPDFAPVTTHEAYISTFHKIQEHLYRGDIYEMNYCVFYVSDQPLSNIPDTWFQRVQRSRAPMSGLFKFGNITTLSHSPERFFTVRNGTLYSQPIKGTIRRGLDEEEDKKLKLQLFESRKERSENVMIVDLVRNDMSRICEIGSVHVDELFGIHTFASVHQMISTIRGQLSPGSTIGDIFRSLFPMGSMTGAPKLSAMNIIERVESHNRGIYSGTAGYVAPGGNMDCSVIIRSVVADVSKGYSYIGVGSAVTIYANATDEYDECLLKLSSVIS
ncbi:MAG: chorismate-binding protein [Thermaurantimonas sp.]